LKPTKISNLVLLALLVAIGGFFVIRQMIGSGLPAPAAGLNIVLLQPALAIILTLSAIPIMRYRSGLKKFEEAKGKRPAPVDSAYAIRTLALAKAVSLTGSIFTGWQAAILINQLLTPIGSKLFLTIFGLIGALSMVAAGIVIENLFRIPPDRDGDTA
jgi:ABC-type sugar transport system permease subunit